MKDTVKDTVDMGCRCNITSPCTIGQCRREAMQYAAIPLTAYGTAIGCYNKTPLACWPCHYTPATQKITEHDTFLNQQIHTTEYLIFKTSITSLWQSSTHNRMLVQRPQSALPCRLMFVLCTSTLFWVLDCNTVSQIAY